MKLLTLNTHSLIEKNPSLKAKILAETILKEKIDVAAFQEVNQSISAEGIICSDIEGDIKKDNYLSEVMKNLGEKHGYKGIWLPIKNGYGKFDEGIAILTRFEILRVEEFYVSKIIDPANWKTRRILGIETPAGWFFSVHMGFWKDEDSFKNQWKRLCDNLPCNNKIWLMGDFNSPSHVKNEGYDLILKSSWYDSYNLAKEKDSGATAKSNIDGWKNGDDEMRIDYIFSNFKADVKSSFVVFNGVREEKISDHNGVIIETEA